MFCFFSLSHGKGRNRVQTTRKEVRMCDKDCDTEIIFFCGCSCGNRRINQFLLKSSPQIGDMFKYLTRVYFWVVNCNRHLQCNWSVSEESKDYFIILKKALDLFSGFIYS